MICPFFIGVANAIGRSFRATPVSSSVLRNFKCFARAVTLVLTALTAAVPAQSQSTLVPTKAETTAREKLATEKRETEMKKNQLASETRDKEWDAKMKRTMSGMCRGC